MVHRIDELDGTLFLSERRARALKTWEKVIEAHDHDEVIEATVTQVVKGGVLVDLGMRGFVPASQIRRQPVGNLDELVGQHLRLKVIDLDHKRHRVVLSQRLVLEEELQAKKQELLDTLEVGQIREGVVVRFAEFGAFVDLGGIDGLIHNSELAYARIKHPSEVVKIGDVVQVEIMKFDPEAKKVSLSLKHALPDPWDRVCGSAVRDEQADRANRKGYAELPARRSDSRHSRDGTQGRIRRCGAVLPRDRKSR